MERPELLKTHVSLERALRRWLTTRAKASSWRRSQLIRHLLQAARGRIAAAGSVEGTLTVDADLGPDVGRSIREALPTALAKDMTLTLAGRRYRLVEIDGPNGGADAERREGTDPVDLD